MSHITSFARFWVTIGLASLLSGLIQAQTPTPQNDFFQAKLIVALSDADMIPSAYVDGQLGPLVGSDVLNVLTFNGRQAAPTSVTPLPISNSVTGPPAAVATTPDGRYAITIETRGQRPASGADVKLIGLANGRTVTVVDLANPQHPRVVQRLVGPARPVSVEISADGKLVALAVHPDGDGKPTPLWLYRFAGGRLTDGTAVTIPGWQAGDELVHALFHPSRPILALTNVTKHEVMLVEVQPAGAGWQVRPWGNRVIIEPGTLLTCFSPDGRYFFANGSPSSSDPKTPGHGVLLSIRLDAQPGQSGGPVHQVVSRANTGHIPEGLAVSPDGQLLVTVNLEYSYLPLGTSTRGRFASLSLFALNPATGALTAAGDFAFDGMLPESAVFDRSSRRLAVANYGQLDNLRSKGSIDFWRVVGEVEGPERLRLVKMAYSLPVQRGVHTLSIVR